MASPDIIPTGAGFDRPASEIVERELRGPWCKGGAEGDACFFTRDQIVSVQDGASNLAIPQHPIGREEGVRRRQNELTNRRIRIGDDARIEQGSVHAGDDEVVRPSAFKPTMLADAIDRHRIEPEAPMRPPEVVDRLAAGDDLAPRSQHPPQALDQRPWFDRMVQALVE